MWGWSVRSSSRTRCWGTAVVWRSGPCPSTPLPLHCSPSSEPYRGREKEQSQVILLCLLHHSPTVFVSLCLRLRLSSSLSVFVSLSLRLRLSSSPSVFVFVCLRLCQSLSLSIFFLAFFALFLHPRVSSSPIVFVLVCLRARLSVSSSPSVHSTIHLLPFSKIRLGHL